MAREVHAIVLAGHAGDRRATASASLARRLGIVPPLLVMGDGRPLALHWVEAIEASLGATPCFAVGTDLDACKLREILRSAAIVTDGSAFRGPAGVLRDALARLGGVGAGASIAVIESSMAPTRELTRLLSTMLDARVGQEAPPPQLAVGVDGVPLGAMILSPSDIARVPEIGFQDLKEQLLPALHAIGRGAVPFPSSAQPVSLRSREQYLAAVRRARSEPWVGPSASVAADATVAGASLVGREVVVAEGAVVLDSVLLEGATVGEGAVVARSVVGPRASVERGEYLVDDVISADMGPGVAA